MSEDELIFLSDTDDIAQGVKSIWQAETQLIAVTKGGGGCVAFTESQQWTVPGYSVRVEDTIGAGDGFVAGLLSGILSLGDPWLSQDLHPILKRANAVGAVTASRAGAIPALPTATELENFMLNR